MGRDVLQHFRISLYRCSEAGNVFLGHLTLLIGYHCSMKNSKGQGVLRKLLRGVTENYKDNFFCETKRNEETIASSKEVKFRRKMLYLKKPIHTFIDLLVVN